MSKPVIVSGIQPTGNLHIGNYLGAVKNWLELQSSGKYDLYIFIADLHSLTGKISAQQLREQTKITVAELLAAGIDPKKTTFFVQSHVPQHSELAWIFNCVTPISELYRMTQFKDKSEHQEKNINTGLLTYPILQKLQNILHYRNGVQAPLLGIFNQNKDGELRIFCRRVAHEKSVGFRVPQYLRRTGLAGNTKRQIV